MGPFYMVIEYTYVYVFYLLCQKWDIFFLGKDLSHIHPGPRTMVERKMAFCHYVP